MSALDDELVEALLHRIKVGLATVPAGGPTDRLLQQCSEVIRALRDALARDAQVREIVGDPWGPLTSYRKIAALYPEVASMLRDGKGVDDSDIMPGSEFDGPVVL